ncbi:hypothetical protein QZH41_010245 [Actinostola sp. cb2023]|nr:hypothetical protein QZH41_010245 [Actinostola sp. cb2023]
MSLPLDTVVRLLPQLNPGPSPDSKGGYILSDLHPSHSGLPTSDLVTLFLCGLFYGQGVPPKTPESPSLGGEGVCSPHLHLFGLKGKRVTQRVTFNPSTARPGETLYISVPILPTDLPELYTDLWRSKEEQANLVEQGIQSAEVSKHWSTAGDKNNAAGDIALAKAFPKYRIPLDGLGALEIFRTHGALPTKDLPEIRIEVTLAPAADVIVSSDIAKVGEYLLENIVLEYQTIEPDVRSTILAPPNRLVFNYITHHATITFDRATQTVLSDAIQIQRRSFVGILGLFVTPHTVGTRDTGAFQDPGISKVEFDIDGQSNVLYQHGMLPSDLWVSAQSGAEWLLGEEAGGRTHRPAGFFPNKFMMFIDLRAARDALVHGDGRNSMGPGRNIQYRIHRSGGTGNCALHLYILSEGAFELEQDELYK